MGLWLLLLGCGAGEAQDPGDVLGDYRQHNGVDARTGIASAPTTQTRLATQAECSAAARRIETLALEIAVEEEPDDAKRAELQTRMQAELASKDFEARVQRQTEGCLGRETNSAEAKCIAKIRSADDLDRCSSP
ncbi:MAG TPA: hypothetical protein PKA88_08620 [Polyangiaceae bacterium]|nr:hypothetical protein [Polyangiaceae bacterium]HMR77600.1 hypothetical protein [Polyangiaceae bacterium]